MEVILREDVPKLGTRGDLVTVKEGYARNYLLPRKLAMPATVGNRKQLEEMKAATARRLAKEKSSAEAVAAQMAELTLTLSAKAGEADRLFGSVTAMDIAEALAAKGFPVDKRRVELGQPIKTLGEYEVPIRLHPEVTATVKVTVVPEE
ncbi:50S ribosomal protein L9 [Acidobacteriia bacterium AH_259_A11_L15]|nr:50S ribosomal protein L9 [Acidobacteriia bacterium AH_259_A11_L15]